MSNKPAYRIEPSERVELRGRDGATLGILHHNVKDHAGENCYAILACHSGNGSVVQIPLPWAVISVDARTGVCRADIDHLQLLEAPHCPNADFAHFDADLAGRVDSAFGLEFPGIESINDFA